MRGDSYRIMDEPDAGLQGGVVVRPMFIFLGLMIGGAWLAWPWYVINSMSLGSSTRRTELMLVAAGVVGSLVLSFGLLALVVTSTLSIEAFRYALIGLVVFKLGIGFRLEQLQRASFELHETYGGVVQNGMFGVVLGIALRTTVLGLSDHLLWQLVMA